jgi:hypothetical protein
MALPNVSSLKMERLEDISVPTYPVHTQNTSVYVPTRRRPAPPNNRQNDGCDDHLQFLAFIVWILLSAYVAHLFGGVVAVGVVLISTWVVWMCLTGRCTESNDKCTGSDVQAGVACAGCLC